MRWNMMLKNILMIATVFVTLIGCTNTNNTSSAVDNPNSTSKDGVQLTSYAKATQINVEEVVSITISSETDVTINVPKERYYTIIDGLYWLNESIARAEEQEEAKEPVVLRIETKTDQYEIPYDLATNRLFIEEDWVYADYNHLLMMNGLIKPNSEVGKIDTLMETVRLDFEANPTVIDSSHIDFEQAKVDSKDYIAWEKELLNAETTLKLMYYDSGTEKIQALSFYTNGIVALNRQLLFTDPKYKTQSGIHVGMSREEALQNLGVANIDLDMYWGYKIGDYIKFHLYFADNKITWLSLTMPL